MITIYALLDPITKDIRYVGKTVNLKQRYNQHLKDKSKTYKNSWIKSLYPLLPEIIILDEVDQKDWEFWEKYWISQAKSWGFNLTNLTSGGIGHYNFKRSKELNDKVSNILKGKIITKETRNKLSKSKKGIKFTEKHKNNLSKSHIGLKYDSTNYGKHTKTKICQYEDNKLIKIWNSIKEAAEFYNVNYTSISHCCAGRKKKIKGFVWKYHTTK